MKEFLVLIAIYSATFGWIESDLFDRARDFVERIHPKLVSCYHCVGFYAGILVSVLAYESISIQEVLLWGLAGSGFTLVVDSAHRLLESWIDK